MERNVNLSEMEDVVINAISPAHMVLGILLEGGEIDIIHLEKAKNKLLEIKTYIRRLRGD